MRGAGQDCEEGEVEMIDYKELMNKLPMTEEERDKLWKDWYDGLPESEKKIVDKQREKL
jgi:hypothetical protein